METCPAKQTIRSEPVSLYGSYDPDNIFAKILRGEAPCFRIYETDTMLGFLDLFPQAPGHSLVIPKQGIARNILEIDPVQLGALHQAAQVVAKGIVAELEPDGVQIMQFNGGPGGQSVFHIHVHIIPRQPGQKLGLHGHVRGDDAELAVMGERLWTRLMG
jgi:histidine triad (HIT) family protein